MKVEKKKLPREWELVKLSSYVDFFYGFPFDSTQFNDKGVGTPLVRIRDLKRSYTDTFFDGEYEEKYLTYKDDLLIGMDGEFNIIRWEGESALLNQRICKLVIRSEELHPYFLYKALVKILKEIEDKTPHVTVKHLSSKQLQSIEIPLPPLKTQRKIVAILEKVEATQRLRAEADALMWNLIENVFIKLFGNPLENPFGWKVKRLEEVSKIVSGVTKGRKFNDQATIWVPYLRVANVQDGYLDLTEIKEIEVLESDVDKYALHPGDVLLTEGGDRDKLGRGAVWKGEVTLCLHQNHVFRVRVNSDLLTPEYLSMLTGSMYGKMYFLRSAKQTTGIASINSTQLKNFPVYLPPLELQHEFSEFVNRAEELKQKQSYSRQRITLLFESLMSNAFTGELVA
ncbi:restriction endonuclease subunit S [Methanoculleus sp.]|uniref:restriction endonuclease subunit S n=1 Tax=Methanoculleus sp. TaxID=90427 RepID=UPI002FC897E3